MFSFVSVTGDQNTVNELNNANDGYEYELVELGNAKRLLGEQDIAAMTTAYEEVAGDYVANKLAAVAGAVAVSVYKHAGFDVAFDSVARLAAAGMKQINFHFMISEKTIGDAYTVIQAMKEDPRLVGNINAIVFLSLKQKGRGTKYDYVSQEQYKALVDHCLANEVPFGFDSCSAAQFLESVEGTPNYTKFLELSEPCESTLFSSYVSETGVFFPCSFTEGWVEGGWSKENGINVLEAEDFIRDVWNHPRTVEFRHALIGNTDERGCRNCPAYEVCGKKGYMLELTETGYQHVSTEPVGDITITEVV